MSKAALNSTNVNSKVQLLLIWDERCRRILILGGPTYSWDNVLSLAISYRVSLSWFYKIKTQAVEDIWLSDSKACLSLGVTGAWGTGSSEVSNLQPGIIYQLDGSHPLSTSWKEAIVSRVPHIQLHHPEIFLFVSMYNQIKSKLAGISWKAENLTAAKKKKKKARRVGLPGKYRASINASQHLNLNPETTTMLVYFLKGIKDTSLYFLGYISSSRQH